MSRRMSFIMQAAAVQDEIGWLEHQLKMAEVSGASIGDQASRLRELAARITAIADQIQSPADLKQVA